MGRTKLEDACLLLDKYVARLEISVEDTALVEIVDSKRELHDPREDLLCHHCDVIQPPFGTFERTERDCDYLTLWNKLAAGFALLVKEHAKVAAIAVFADHAHNVAVNEAVIAAQDVGMLQLRGVIDEYERLARVSYGYTLLRMRASFKASTVSFGSRVPTKTFLMTLSLKSSLRKCRWLSLKHTVFLHLLCLQSRRQSQSFPIQAWF